MTDIVAQISLNTREAPPEGRRKRKNVSGVDWGLQKWTWDAVPNKENEFVWHLKQFSDRTYSLHIHTDTPPTHTQLKPIQHIHTQRNEKISKMFILLFHVKLISNFVYLTSVFAKHSLHHLMTVLLQSVDKCAFLFDSSNYGNCVPKTVSVRFLCYRKLSSCLWSIYLKATW